MNSFKTSLIAKSIAAACFVAGLASSAVALEPKILGTPNDGTSCRSGYTGAFDGTSLKCSKTSKIAVQLVCIDPGFTRYVARVSAGGTQQGEDVCAKSGGLHPDVGVAGYDGDLAGAGGPEAVHHARQQSRTAELNQRLVGDACVGGYRVLAAPGPREHQRLERCQDSAFSYTR